MVELPPYLSPSSASVFEGCPRRWRFKYVDRLKDPSGQAALVGTFAHEVLEALCGLAAAERTIEQAKALAKELWPTFAEQADYLELELAEAEARSFRWQAWLAIAGLWDIEDPSTVEVVSTEQRVKADLSSVPFLGIIDRVDRLDGKLVVSDYKSGILPGHRWRGEKIQQVMLYAAALRIAMGELPDKVRLLYLGQRILDVHVTERRVEEAVAALETTWEQVTASCATEEFAPKPAVLCGWCPFIEHCKEGQVEMKRRSEAGTLPAHAPAANLIDSFPLETAVDPTLHPSEPTLVTS